MFVLAFFHCADRRQLFKRSASQRSAEVLWWSSFTSSMAQGLSRSMIFRRSGGEVERWRGRAKQRQASLVADVVFFSFSNGSCLRVNNLDGESDSSW